MEARIDRPRAGTEEGGGRPHGDSRPRSVLVTDGTERSSLATVRSLGQAGYDVMTCANRERSLAGRSRFTRRSWSVSDPLNDPEGYVDDVARIVAEQAVDVVLPVTEPSLLALLPARERLSPSVVPFGDSGTFIQLLDKAEVLGRAPQHGIAVPKQVVLDEPDSVDRVSVDELSFPVVLKPRRSVGIAHGARKSVAVTHVPRASDLADVVRRQPHAAFPLLAQERIEGPGAGVFLLLDGDGVVARFAHRRLREKPPSGGVSVLRESIRPDEVLFERARSLLEDFGWEGVAMVEFKVSERTGEPYLMEVNPRLWGSLQLAIDAGVDFPVLLVRNGLGEPVPIGTDYVVGTRTRWFWGDVDHHLARIKSTIGEGGVARKVEQLADAVGSFASDWGTGTRFEVLRWSDPGPFIQESVDWWRDLLTGPGRKVG